MRYHTGTSVGIVYVGNDDGNLYARAGSSVSTGIDCVATGGNVRSSPAIAYIPDDSGNLDRWIFVTSRGYGGRLYAFKTDREE